MADTAFKINGTVRRMSATRTQVVLPKRGILESLSNHTRPANFQHSTRVMQPPRIASLLAFDQEFEYEVISLRYG